jgi:hypothetical protein
MSKDELSGARDSSSSSSSLAAMVSASAKMHRSMSGKVDDNQMDEKPHDSELLLGIARVDESELLVSPIMDTDPVLLRLNVVLNGIFNGNNVVNLSHSLTTVDQSSAADNSIVNVNTAIQITSNSEWKLLLPNKTLQQRFMQELDCQRAHHALLDESRFETLANALQVLY